MGVLAATRRLWNRAMDAVDPGGGLAAAADGVTKDPRVKAHWDEAHAKALALPGGFRSYSFEALPNPEGLALRASGRVDSNDLEPLFRPGLSRDELRAEYRRLLNIHHPNNGGDVEMLRRVVAEYQERTR